MARNLPQVDPDIRRARTLPGAMYGDEEWFQRQSEVLARSWHLAPIARDEPATGQAIPWTLLPGCLDEPLVWTRDPEGRRHCLSNVCTHRGKLLVPHRGEYSRITCSYHGRCFDLDGRFRAAPGFEDMPDFPRDTDSLAEVDTGYWAGLAYASLAPATAFEDWIAPLQEWMGWWAGQELPERPDWEHDYEFDAHWALYVDNYLEGFHIPYVHPELQRTLDPEVYETVLFEQASVQAGFARADEPTLELPAGHPHHGRPVAGYFFFLFPTTLLNFYPWGLSINVVEPLAPRRTRVRYQQYVLRPDLRRHGAGGDLETVEAQDEDVVVATQHGVQGRLYRRGRYAPEHEQAVHHFHRLLVAALAEPRD